MTSFTFSIEQVRSAPPEVRRWIERELTLASPQVVEFSNRPQCRSAA
jgi:hypothetical protein